MNNLSRILHRLSISASFLAASGLLLEQFLSQAGKSLCHTSACEIVTKFVRLGEPLLLSLGAAGFLLLAVFIFFAGRYGKSPFIRSLPVLILIGAAAFDGALLGFQFITLRQHCQLCITVALSLVLIALCYSVSLKKWSIFCSVLTVWISGFLANAILIMPDTTETRAGMTFYEQPAAKEMTTPPAVATLIFSLACPHCTDLLESLAKINPNTMTWRFALIDKSPQAYNKLGYFYANLPTSTNPFQLLLDAKNKHAKLTDKTILARLPELTRQARVFLSTNSLRTIPVLVYKETNGRITMISGSSEIASFLSSRKP